MAELSNSVLRRLAAAQRPADHPEPVLLSAFAEGALRAEEREGVLAHLALCPECREVLSLAAAAAAEPEKQLVHAAPSFGGWLLRRKAIVATAFACLLVASVVLLRPWRRPGSDQFAAASTSQPVLGQPSASLPSAKPSASPAPAAADQVSPTRNDRSVAEMRAAPAPHPVTIPRVDVAAGSGTAGRLQVEAQAPPPMIQTSASTRGAAGGASDVVGSVAPQQSVSVPAPSPPPAAVATESNAEMQIRARDSYGVRQSANTIQQGANNQPAGNAQQSGNRQTAGNAGNFYISGAEGNDNTLRFADQRDSNASRAQSNAASVPESKTDSGAGVVRSYESVNGNLVPAPAGVLAAAPKTQSSLARKALNKPLAIMRWIISAEGKLQRSFDSGHSWETVSVGAPVTFRATDADAIGDHVWAGGEGAALYRSADGGQSWSRVVPAAGTKTLTGDIVSVRTVGPDARIVRLRTSTGQNWVSNDQGQHWQLEE